MLPSNASFASRLRLSLAQELETNCPMDFGQAVAVTGSVSLGVADHFSDLELNFWVEQPRPVTEYQAWLQSVGALVEPVSVNLADGSVWTKSWFQGVFVEAGWQTFDALDAQLGSIVIAESIEHAALTMAWTVRNAASLRQHTRFQVWDQRLQCYPDILRIRLLADAVQTWSLPLWWPASVISIWPLVYRQSGVELSGRLLWEVEKALRFLFALNHQWEPEWKWLKTESEQLVRKPDHLVERIQAVVAGSDAEQRTRECLDLILDTLSLAAEVQDVTLPIQHVQEAIAFDPHTDTMSR